MTLTGLWWSPNFSSSCYGGWHLGFWMCQELFGRLPWNLVHTLTFPSGRIVLTSVIHWPFHQVKMLFCLDNWTPARQMTTSSASASCNKGMMVNIQLYMLHLIKYAGIVNECASIELLYEENKWIPPLCLPNGTLFQNNLFIGIGERQTSC